MIEFIARYPNYVKCICEIPIVKIIDQLNYITHIESQMDERFFAKRCEVGYHEEIHIFDIDGNSVFLNLTNLKLIYSDDPGVNISLTELEEIKMMVSNGLLNFL